MGAPPSAWQRASTATTTALSESVKVTFSGDLQPGVSAKDAALEMIRILGADGANYQSIEMHAGDRFTRGERMTLANLCVEAGAKVGLVVPAAVGVGLPVERRPVRRADRLDDEPGGTEPPRVHAATAAASPTME